MIFKNILDFLKNPYEYSKENPTSKLKYLLILIGWTFQGILYADTTEKIYKIFCDIFLMCIFFIILFYLFGSSLIFLFLLAILFGHTMNWLINVGIWCSLRGKYGIDIPGVGVLNKDKFFSEFISRIKKSPGILAVLVYGSYARGEDKFNSDVDIRVIRRPGFFYGFTTCLFGTTERTRALFNKVPLDLCVIDSVNHLKKMNEDEHPLLIFDPDNIFETKKN